MTPQGTVLAASPASPQLNSVNLMGLRVDRVDMTTAIELVGSFIDSGKPHQILTADASMVVSAAEDPDLARIADNCALVTADGIGILWATKRLGIPVTNKVSGVDLAARCCELSAEKSWRIYFFGAGPGVAETAAKRIQEKHPGALIVGARDGFFTAADEPAIVEAIRAAKPDILLVALGIPKQEKFIDRHRTAMGVPVSIGVGGTLDVFAGAVKRAPKWMQNAGLEWLYRIGSDPRRRIKKAKALPRFVRMALRAKPGPTAG